MSRVDVQLLGRPAVCIDGIEATAPKGAKVWGLLAYLASSERMRLRSELAALLFGEAVDPLGALRWNLAALRRLLDRPDGFKGDAIGLDRSDVQVDVVRLDDGDPDALTGGGGSRELLAGLRFPDSPVFEVWLTGERERLARRVSSLRREVSLDALARGDHDVAIRVANELVATEPFDEGHHALLIRALALSGAPDAHEAARRQFERCGSLLRRELHTEPGPAVLAAAHLVTHPIDDPAVLTCDEIAARMNVAWQSFLAGAIDHALDMSRSTVVLSDRSGDVGLRITGRIFLAATLGMSVRGWDEAATMTAEARKLAADAGMDGEVALADGIQAGNELMRGDYRAAHDHALAGAAGSVDPGALALNLTLLGAVESDTGRGEQARGHALEAVAHAERSGDSIRLAYAHAYAAHVDLYAGRHDAARLHVERAIDACEAILVLKPWPMAMLAELEVHDGDLARAIDVATRADGLATATGMSYQRALAQRALALADAADGDDHAALDRLTVALVHARHTTGQGYAFHWPVAWVLESLASVSARSRPSEARRWARALQHHVAATGMATFEARATDLLDATSSAAVEAHGAASASP